MTVFERVMGGVGLLDKILPKWKEKIDLEKFTISSPYYCILGQLFGDYHYAKTALDLDETDAYELGFTFMSHELADVEKAWVEYLKREKARA